jgi:hypothetical protein
MNHQEILDDGLACANLFTQSLFKRPESLSKYLPYESFIKDQKVFLLKDGSLGAIYKVNLLEHETMSAQEIIGSVDSLRSWFNLPTNCTFQVSFDQSYVSSLDKRWEQMRNSYPDSHSVSKILFEEKIKKFRFASDELRVMERKAYISIRFYPDYMKKGGHYKELFKKGEHLLFQETKVFLKELKSFVSLLKDLEMNSKVKLNVIGASELVEYLRKCFNPKTFYKREFAKFNESIPISEQIIYNSPILDYSGIERENVKSRTLSLKTAPSFAYSGGMSYFLKLDIPFTISMNFSFPTEKKTNSFFNFKHILLEKAASESAKRQLNEIKEVQTALAHGDRCLYLTFNINIEATTEDELDEMERRVASIFNDDLSCEIIREDDIGLGLFLNGLPLNYTPKADLSAARFIRILKSDAIKFIPIFDSFKGMDRPQGLYLSRENNLAPFKLPKGHTVVVADTGSGKSNFIIDCVQAAKLEEVEPLIFVIDRKSSYKMVAPNFDGDLTIFDPTEDMPFSPFRGVYDEQKISFLTKLISTAIKLSSPSFDLESEHTAAINKALKYAYLDKLEKMGLVYLDGDLVNVKDDEGVEVELSMDDVVAQLASLTALKEFEKLEDEITTLLNKLKPFYGDGLYAKFFRESTSKKKKRKHTLFYAYDLDALSTDETLQSLMTMSVIEEIRQTIKLPENEGRGGYIVIEELGMFGRNNKEASSFIIDAAETFRKLGYFLIGLTPRVSNYFDLEVGKAMWNLSTNYIFLQMKEDDVDFILENSNVLDESTAPIVKSLRTVLGQYADVFYVNKTKTLKGAFRYIQTIFDRWLAPTNSLEEVEAKKARKKFGQHKWQALEYLAKTLPQGITA